RRARHVSLYGRCLGAAVFRPERSALPRARGLRLISRRASTAQRERRLATRCFFAGLRFGLRDRFATTLRRLVVAFLVAFFAAAFRAGAFFAAVLRAATFRAAAFRAGFLGWRTPTSSSIARSRMPISEPVAATLAALATVLTARSRRSTIDWPARP